MIKIVEPHSNTSLPVMRSILFVFHPTFIKHPTRTPWQSTKKSLLDYHTNARSLEYMLELAAKFRVKYAPEARCDLLLYAYNNSNVPTEHRSWINHILQMEQIEGLSASEDPYDTIVLLYPDPLGMGWANVEKKLISLKSKLYLVINGRRRIFVWDKESRRALFWRRLLVKSWLLEIVLVPITIIVALILACFDFFTHQSDQ